MDIVEYVEKTYEIKLLEYQKIYLRALYNEYNEYKKHGKMVIPMTSRMSCIEFYTYLKHNNLPNCRELIQIGTTIDSDK